MRPRSSRLLLVGALPLAISGCSDSEPDVTYTVKKHFRGVPACVAAKFPVDVCSESYMQAMIDHHRIAPVYDDQTTCDADFDGHYCQLTSNGRYMPRMTGFELAMSGELPWSQYDEIEQLAKQQAARSGGTDSTVAAAAAGGLAIMLIGKAMSNRSALRFQAQPIYLNRDSRGSYQTSILARRIRQQENNEAASGAGGYGSSGSSRSGNAFHSGTNGTSVSASLSRGGFGQQATARSGWGGKRSGFGG